MNITDLLDKSKTLEERIAILKDAYNKNFEELEKLNPDIIYQVASAVNDILKESNKKNTELDMSVQEKNRILNDVDQIVQEKSSELTPEEFVDLYRKKENARVQIDEIMNEKTRIAVSPDIIEKLNQKQVSIETNIMNEARRKALESMNYIEQNIESLKNTIGVWTGFLNKYVQNDQEIRDTLVSIITQSEGPDRDELFERKMDELKSLQDKMKKCNEKLDEYYKTLEEQEKKLAEYQKNAEKAEAKEQKAAEKQAKADAKTEAKEQRDAEKQEQAEQKVIEEREKLQGYIDEFMEICSKDKLSFLEKERRSSLYHIIANSKYADVDQRKAAFNSYVESINKAGNEIIGKCSDKLNPQKHIPVVSSVRSIVAKGAIATINRIESVFATVKNVAINVATTVTEKIQQHEENKFERLRQREENKLSKATNRIERLREINEALKAMNNISELDDSIELEETEVRGMAM